MKYNIRKLNTTAHNNDLNNNLTANISLVTNNEKLNSLLNNSHINNISSASVKSAVSSLVNNQTENAVKSQILNDINKNNSLTQPSSTAFLSLIKSVPPFFLFCGCGFLLLLLILIVVTLICVCRKKKRKEFGDNIANSSVVVNKIVLKRDNLPGIKQNYEFQPVQNNSTLSMPLEKNQNNSLNEIKVKNEQINLGAEIHNIINSGGKGDGSSGRNRRKKKRNNKGTTRSEKNELKTFDGNEDKEGKSSENINKFNLPDDEPNDEELNTQKLEKEVKELMKKFVIIEEKK